MQYDLYHAALGILHDECPERKQFHLCRDAEDDGCGDCTTCWERYLLALINGHVNDHGHVNDQPKQE